MFNSRLKVKKEKAICLTRRKIYIIPTRHGILFACILSVMLFGSMNYNNSMGYALTFLLASISLVSILHTHRTLLGLRVELGKIQPVFAGESAQFQLLIDNSRYPARRALVWQVKPLENKEIQAPEVCIDIPANRQTVVSLSMPTTKRGRVGLERVMVYSQFPLGLFHAWAYLNFDASVIVYPAPVGSEQLPNGELDIQGQNSAQFGSGDDFMGYRDYQFGDSPQHIDWKAVAREKGWLIKQFGGADITQIWLTEESVKTLGLELALSQLCLWVLRADHLATEYGLKIGTHVFQPATGEQHKEQCLKTLALF
jgi:uncharacterized protein (DUF58 family)